MRDVSAGSSTGAPARARTMRWLNDLQITVGDRHREVRGRQAYVIEYAVGWAFTPYADHDELVWDAIGTSWDVPIGDAVVRLADRPLTLIGSGAALLAPRLPGAQVNAVENPDPVAMARLAAAVTEPIPPRPLYLRAPDARLPS